MDNQKRQSLINGNINIQHPETGEVHRTSIRLEKIEWDAMREICRRKRMSLHKFCSLVDFHPLREEHSRTSRIRCAILQYYINRNAVLESAQEEQEKERQRQERQKSGYKYRPGNLSGGTTIA